MPLCDGARVPHYRCSCGLPWRSAHDPGWWWKLCLFTGTPLKPQQGEEAALAPVGHFLAHRLPFQPSLRHFIWGCLGFLVLWLGKEGFSWDLFFFWSVFTGISGSLASPATGLGGMRQKEPRGLSCHVVLECWGPWLLCLLFIFQSCLVLVCSIIPGVLVVDRRRNREKYVDSIFLDMGVLHAGSFGSSPADSVKSNQIEEHDWRMSVSACCNRPR